LHLGKPHQKASVSSHRASKEMLFLSNQFLCPKKGAENRLPGALETLSFLGAPGVSDKHSSPAACRAALKLLLRHGGFSARRDTPTIPPRRLPKGGVAHGGP
jgi:hypothetical protein